MSVANVKVCGKCQKNHARVLSCGHVFHMKCLVKQRCGTCGEPARTTEKIVSEDFDNATQRMTTGANGNAFITLNQQDEWGRTTVIREIKKEKLNEYMTTVKASETNLVNGKQNLGLLFMNTLMKKSDRITSPDCNRQDKVVKL